MYDNNLSFVENLKNLSTILAFVILISGLFSSTAFFYLDYRNDQRYLKLVEITTKLDPLYISIASAKAQQRIEDIGDLEEKIFKLRFKQNTLAKEGKHLEPFDAAILEQYKDELKVLQSK